MIVCSRHASSSSSSSSSSSITTTCFRVGSVATDADSKNDRKNVLQEEEEEEEVRQDVNVRMDEEGPQEQQAREAQAHEMEL
jgi:hypothetical protein